MLAFSHAVVHVFEGNDLGGSPQVVARSVPSRQGKGHDTLLIFLDFPNASAQVCAELAQMLIEGYTRAPGGITSSLRLAINLVNDRAMQLNRGAVPSRRIEGSVSCALLSDDSLILAQAGPAIAFARAASGAFEVIEPWFSNNQPQWVGAASRVDVFFNHFSVNPGDVFVLSGRRSLEGVGEELIEACMSKGEARLVAGYLNANVKRGRMVGVVIAAETPSATRTAPASSAPVMENTTPSARQTAARVHTPTEAAHHASAATAERAPLAASPLRSVGARLSATLGEVLGRAGRAFGRIAAAFIARLLPKEESTVSLPTPSARVITFALAATAVLLPVVIGVVVGVLYFQFSGEAERLQLRAAAEARLEQARQAQTTDPRQVRVLWEAVLRAVDAYEARAPDDRTTFGDVRREARARLDRVLGVVRVSPTVLATFGGEARRRVSVTPLGVYVLDLDANAAFFQRFNATRDALVDQPVSLVFDGQQRAPVPLVDIARATALGNRWRTEGAILFSDAVVYEYSSATGRAIPLDIPEVNGVKPGKVQSGALYENRVYLLDVGVGQIWRYALVNDVLSGANSSYFRSPYTVLRESVDMAIDGAIYVLQSSGAVMKYFNRQDAVFAMSGLPEPFKKPVAIALSGDSPERGSVFVLDSETGAVVELRKNGAFVRQFRAAADEFVGAQDLAVDESGQLLVVMGRDRLYRFLLPGGTP